MEREAVALLDWLETHVSHAFRVGEVVAELNGRLLAASLSCQPDPPREGIVITDCNLLMIWASPGAWNLMGDCLRINPVGRLSFLDVDAHAWASRMAASREPYAPGCFEGSKAGAGSCTP